jgi:AcrR family transcriptional regulator
MADGRRARGEATRARLLATATTLFGERGYEGTSIEAVLERSGVARGALYHHFRSKAELFDAVLESLYAKLASSAGESARAGEDPLEELRRGSHAWLDMAMDPAVQRIALLDPPTALGWARWRELDERYWLGGLRASLGRLEREGRIPAGQSELLARLLYAALNEASLLIAAAVDQGQTREACQQALDTLLERLVPAATI